MTLLRSGSLLLAAAGIFAGTALAVAAPPKAPASPMGRPPAGDEEFFETRVRPLLVGRCGTCHNGDKPAGGLGLKDRASALKGGSKGPALVPGKPEQSLLFQAVAHLNGVPKMPPAAALPASEIETLREWIRRGAYWPATAAVKAEGPLWSAQPVRRPALPRVKNGAWVRNPIDAFILAGLERKGMRPAPEADPRTLIRRLYFDLTGLPPTPEEVDAFVRECAAERASRRGLEAQRQRERKTEGKRDKGGKIAPPGAPPPSPIPHPPSPYERLVDRLLASPRYGERWARYWLDLVRYADSNGYERDAEKPNSWKYRDYVIQSLNSDKPYNRFVTEQLAGDELPDRSEETVTATGFLRLGTWDDEPNDPVEYQYERLDDLVHATSTAFLGLTVRCARCHDHKFDPIPQKDYYAIGAAFWGGYLQPGDGRLLGGPPAERLGFPVLGFTERGPTAPALHLLQNGDSRREGPVVEPGFLSLAPALQRPVAPPPPNASTTHRRLQLAAWITDPRNPLTARVLVNRVWQHHFGQGLVRTPNNFGRKGNPPTHPELLDYLASTFVSGHGAPPASAAGKPWSLKSLHRLILLSSTYRMASVHPDEKRYEQVDFANERWWRFNRQRLDADALRDSMLAVSGQLKLDMGGRGFTPTVNREALEGLSRKGAEWVVSPVEEQRRRSIYMFLKRALIMPFLTVFDFGDTTQPIEARESSIVAPQALALMNNEFSHGQTQALAERVKREAGTDPARQVERLWRLTLGRAPDASERDAGIRHLRRIASAPVPPRAPAAPRQPDSLSQLRLWLRADSGITLDEQGRVSGWKDRSGRGHDAQQAVAVARPELVRDGVNGQPALRFDGQKRFLNLGGQPLTSSGFTILAVVTDRAGAAGHREIFSNWRRENNIGSAVFLGTTGAGAVRFSDDFAPAGILYQPDRPLALSAVTGPGGSAVYQDRATLAERPAPLPGRKLDTAYVIGQQGNIDGEYWQGEIAELLVYDRPLSREELNGVWDYLAARYRVAQRPEPPVPADQALASLCHVLLNTNEFLFVD